MHEKVSDVTILTMIISTFLLVLLGGVIIFFLFAYQKKIYRHQEEVLILNQNFNKTLLLSKLEIQEQTLDHISKELHANISHLISVINLNLSAHLKYKSSTEDENIRETKALVKDLMSEIKSLSVTLNTEFIGKVGFHQLLKRELERLGKTKTFEVSFLETGDRTRLQVEREIILFRLCQEILNNIVKHAYARRIDVRLDYQENQLIVSIKDDGIGFSTEEANVKIAERSSTGLNNIFNRATQINARVTVDSLMGKGTHIITNISF